MLDILKTMQCLRFKLVVLLLLTLTSYGCRDEDSVSLLTNSTDVNSTDVTSLDVDDDHGHDSADVRPEVSADDAMEQIVEKPKQKPTPEAPPKELTELEKVEAWLESVGASTTKEYENNESYVHHIEFKDLVLRAERIKRLKVFPKLDSLSFSKCTFEKGAMDEFREFPRIKYVNFMNCSVTQDTIRFLVDARNLETLRILYNGLDEDTFEVLSQLDQVKNVSLWGVNANYENMGFLSGMKSIEVLNLYRNPLAKINWDVLAGLENLKELWIQESKVTDEGLVGVSRCPNLIKLMLSQNQISDRSLKEIGDLQHLEWLMLGGNRIHGEGLQYLTAQSLKTVYLSNNPFTKESLPHLKEVYPKLADFSPKRRSNLKFVDYVQFFGEEFTHIDVEFYKDKPRSGWSNIEVGRPGGRGRVLHFYEKLTPECFIALGKCTNLINLEIEGIDITEEYYMADFSGLTKMKYLTIAGSDVPITNDIAKVLTGCNKLESMAIDNVDWAPEAFEMFAGMQELDRLEVTRGKVDGRGVQQLAGLGKLVAVSFSEVEFTNPMVGLARLASLKHLFLNGSKLGTPDYEAISMAQQLEMLCLDDTTAADRDIARFRDLRNLGHMSLRNTQVSPGGLMAIAHPANKLNYINHEGSLVSDEQAQMLANRFEWTFGGDCSCGCMDYSPEY